MEQYLKIINKSNSLHYQKNHTHIRVCAHAHTLTYVIPHKSLQLVNSDIWTEYFCHWFPVFSVTGLQKHCIYINIQRPAYNTTPPFPIIGKELHRTCWTTCKITRWSPFFTQWITRKFFSYIQTNWYSTSTTAAVIRNHYPESTKNYVKLISWSYYFTTDHTIQSPTT